MNERVNEYSSIHLLKVVIVVVFVGLSGMIASCIAWSKRKQHLDQKVVSHPPELNPILLNTPPVPAGIPNGIPNDTAFRYI